MSLVEFKCIVQAYIMFWLLCGLVLFYSSVQHLKKQAWKKFGEEHPVRILIWIFGP